jgi:WD40 repeat protein/DNA-binding SARP family transcriptional activator
MGRLVDVARGPAAVLGDDVLEISLLGPLVLSRRGRELPLRGAKRRVLLLLLAVHAGQPVPRERIIDALWPLPERRTGREDATLRVHVSQLRDVLEATRDGPPRVLVTRGPSYLLDPDHVTIDAQRFAHLADEGRALLGVDPAAARERLDAALGSWRGRPLADVAYEEFAQDTIRHLEVVRVRALEDRAEALVALGEDAAAVDDLEALVHTDPARERPVLLLMRALYRLGRQPDALRVARRHGRSLAAQGLEPGPRVRRLEASVLRHDPTLLPERTASPVDLRPGRSVRGYELRARVGAGAIGVVYRAFQAAIGRDVAIKVVHPRLAEEPEFVQGFAREARVIAGLEHPHVVPLYDFWREPAGAFLVLRWMGGGSLRERTHQPMSDAELGRVFGQLTDALAFAHGAGVVHRDVTPSNVLFDTRGNAYLGDFGLAVAMREVGDGRQVSITPPYASPEVLRGEEPSVAADVFGLGVVLAEAATGRRDWRTGGGPHGAIGELVRVATAADPAKRYPDMTAFAAALRHAVGARSVPAPRRTRPNPFKGLAAFGEEDHADFHGRADAIEALVGLVAANGLTAVVGASGSGKSSLVMAGLVPELRAGALPGSEWWSVVAMVPGTDPFEEFHVALRSAAVGHQVAASDDHSRELRLGFETALGDPSRRAVLIVDQFEEVFSSEVDERTRERFLDELLDLALDLSHRVRVVVTLRADFADRPLAHPRLGAVLPGSTLLLGPMLPEQVEDAIRRPAARVGVEVEAGLVAAIVRDTAAAPAFLPLLQFVLSELHERRSEDRLTLEAYRALGGLRAVLEQRAEQVHVSLAPGARIASRQLFLRLTQLGEQGETTRRRVPLTELNGLEPRADVEAALAAFATARLLTYDRDPVTRTPTIEVAHETVLDRWSRYRSWLEASRAELLVHRRVSAAAATWAATGEDDAYLLTGGPLAAATSLLAGDEVELNAPEVRYITESRRADEAAREREAERRREEAVLRRRARRRLEVGLAAVVFAAVLTLVAAFALVERQRADALAATQERESTARALAAASAANLGSSDPDLSLLLALEAAAVGMDAGQPPLDEVVDALHRAVINPRPGLVIDGAGTGLGGQLLRYSADGTWLVLLNDEAGVSIVHPSTGEELGRLPPVEPTAFGVDVSGDNRRLITLHPDGVRRWEWRTGTLDLQLGHHTEVTTAAYAPDGAMIAVGGVDGRIRVWRDDELAVELDGEHTTGVTSIAFDPSGTRLASASDRTAVVWDLASGEVLTRARTDTVVLPIWQIAWNPRVDAVGVTTSQGELFLFDASTGERLYTYGNGQNLSRAIAFDATGGLLVAAGTDGVGRVYSTLVGGEPLGVAPTGGVPLRDVAFDPSRLSLATLGFDGRIRIWSELLASELPARPTNQLYPYVVGSQDGERYLIGANGLPHGTPAAVVPTMEVVDAATGRSLVRRPAARTWELRRPAISSDGALVAFAAPSGEIELAAVDTEVATTLPGSADRTAGLAFNSDDTLLAGGGLDGSVGVWDVGTGELVGSLDASVQEPPPAAGDPARAHHRTHQVVFRPGGTQLVSAGVDRTLRAWDPLTDELRELHTFERYDAFSVAFSPDGDVLAAADRSGTIVLLDADSGALLGEPERVSGRTELVFSPDGSLVAGAGPGPIVHLWDRASGRIVRRLHGAIYPPRSVAFVNGGQEVRVAGGDGTDRGYVLDPLRLVALAREQVTRDLTAAECETYLRRPCDRPARAAG